MTEQPDLNASAQPGLDPAVHAEIKATLVAGIRELLAKGIDPELIAIVVAAEANVMLARIWGGPMAADRLRAAVAVVETLPGIEGDLQFAFVQPHGHA